MPLPRQSGLYIHFPFCRRRCHYCDFNTYAVPEIPVERYTSAVLRELSTRAHELTETRIVSIFFGGGTPGLWGAGPVGEVLRAAVRALGIRDLPEIEVSIEINPGECDEDRLRAYREAGVNRVSFGVQALSDRLLASLDRIHTAEEARQALRAARRAGFREVSVDLIFGLPGQTLDRWERDLSEAIALSPNHVSVYNLTVEEGTPLHRFVRDGKVRLPPEDRQLRMMARAKEILAAAGIERYEISNYARPGHESVHNTLYWTGRPYLGLGAGAHSFTAAPDALGRRTTNARKYTDYMDKIEQHGTAVTFEEPITADTHVRERMMTGLRLDRGVDLFDVALHTGLDVRAEHGRAIDRLVAEGLLDWATPTVLRLTERGVAVSDSVFLRFF